MPRFHATPDKLGGFTLWCFAAMMSVSVIFELGYLPYLQHDEYLRSLTITLLYGLAMGSCLWLTQLAAWTGVRRLRARRSDYEPTLLYQCLVSTVGIDLGIILGERIKSAILHVPMAPLGLSIVGDSFIALAFVFLGYFRTYRDKYEQTRISTLRAEYHALQTQMQPHFLFNALNALAELIETSPAQAAIAAQRLSDLYHEILRGAEHNTNSLAAELSIARKYLEIEQLRFPERLRFAISSPPEIEAIRIPSLALQELVENAIKHGVSRALEGGRVQIDVQAIDDGDCRITVTNSGAPLGASAMPRSGLANLQRRLELLYGGDRRLTLATTGDGETIASFHVPVAPA